jgi:hypothetical protein
VRQLAFFQELFSALQRDFAGLLGATACGLLRLLSAAAIGCNAILNFWHVLNITSLKHFANRQKSGALAYGHQVN